MNRIEAIFAAVAAALLLVLYALIRRARKPEFRLDITTVEFGLGVLHDKTKRGVHCLVCGFQWYFTNDDSYTPNPKVTCDRCGQSGPLRDVQASMRKRLEVTKAERQRAARAAQAAVVAKAEETKDGGRQIDL